jgi:hypothetical protein
MTPFRVPSDMDAPSDNLMSTARRPRAQARGGQGYRADPGRW